MIARIHRRCGDGPGTLIGSHSVKTCENCGSRVYSLGCTWCNEDAYIEQQQHFDDLHERDRKAEQRADLSDDPPRGGRA